MLRSSAHTFKKNDSVFHFHTEIVPTSGGTHYVRRRFVMSGNLRKQSERTDGRACVCVGADAFSAHLRNVCRGHSLKAPPTDNVYADIKASFRSADEARLLTQRACVRACVYLSLCVTVRLRREETTGLCNEGGEEIHQRCLKDGKWRRCTRHVVFEAS